MQRIAAVAKDTKAQDLAILDMRRVATFCDYFIILSGTSLRHVNALSEAIQEDLGKEKVKLLSRPSPHDESGWVVLDYSDVVVHIFYRPLREFYGLERLWSDAKKIRTPRKNPQKKPS